MKEGLFPLWNPYASSGMPFFADIQAAVLYPPNLFLTIFADDTWMNPLVLEYQVVLHILFGGIFMYWLCRELELMRPASILAAIVFMFSAFFTTHIFHINLIHTGVWFPLIILLARRALARRSPIYAALCSLVLANAVLAEFPQLMLYVY
jgi:hypothetical protein